MYSDDTDQCTTATIGGLSYFTTGGGAIMFVFGLIGLLTGAVSAVITVPVVAVGAIVLGVIGIRHAIREYKHKQVLEEHSLKVQEDTHEELIKIARHLERDLKELEQAHRFPPPDDEKEIDGDAVFMNREVQSIYRDTPHFFAVEVKLAANDVFEEVATAHTQKKLR